MIFEEMFESAKTALLKETVDDVAAWAAMQVSVTGDGSGIFYVKVSDGALDVQPYDYRDHDVSLTVDSADLLDALTKKKTETLELIGDDEKVTVIRTVLSTIPAARKRKVTAATEEKPAAAKAPAKPAGRCAKKPAAAKTVAAKAETPKAASAPEKATSTKAATASVKETATTAKATTTATKVEKPAEV